MRLFVICTSIEFVACLFDPNIVSGIIPENGSYNRICWAWDSFKGTENAWISIQTDRAKEKQQDSVMHVY
jgi:hypothetical protein